MAESLGNHYSKIDECCMPAWWISHNDELSWQHWFNDEGLWTRRSIRKFMALMQLHTLFWKSSFQSIERPFFGGGCTSEQANYDNHTFHTVVAALLKLMMEI